MIGSVERGVGIRRNERGNMRYLIIPMVIVILVPVINWALDESTLSGGSRYDHWRQKDWNGGPGAATTTDKDTTSYFEDDAVLTPVGYFAMGIDWNQYQSPPGMKSVYSIKDSPWGTPLAAGVNDIDPPYTGRVYAGVYDSDWYIIDWVDLGRIGSGLPHDQNIVTEATSLANAYIGLEEPAIFCGVTTSDTRGTLYYNSQEPMDDYTDIPVFSGWEYIQEDDQQTLWGNDISRINTMEPFIGFNGVVCGTSPTGKVVYYCDPEWTFNDPDIYVQRLGDSTDINRFKTKGSVEWYALTGASGKVYNTRIWDFDGVNLPQWKVFNDFTPRQINDSYSFGNYSYIATGEPAKVFRSLDQYEWMERADFSASAENVLCLGHIGNLIIAGCDDGKLRASFDNGVTWGVAGDFAPDLKIYDIIDMPPPNYYTMVCCGDETGGIYEGEIPDESYIVSSAFDTDSSDTTYGRITWSVDLNGGGCDVFVRTVDNAADASEWDRDDFSYIPNGEFLEGADKVNRGDRYIQYLVVLSRGDSGETPVLDWIDIEIGNLGYDSLLPEEELHVAPNPVTGNSFMIHYALSENANVTATLYDIKGRHVDYWETSGEAFQKNKPILADVGGVAPGVYILTVEAKSVTGEVDTVVKKVAVIK